MLYRIPPTQRNKKGHGKPIRRLAMTSILKRDPRVSRPPDWYAPLLSDARSERVKPILRCCPQGFPPRHMLPKKTGAPGAPANNHFLYPPSDCVSHPMARKSSPTCLVTAGSTNTTLASMAMLRHAADAVGSPMGVPRPRGPMRTGSATHTRSGTAHVTAIAITVHGRSRLDRDRRRATKSQTRWHDGVIPGVGWIASAPTTAIIVRNRGTANEQQQAKPRRLHW